MSFHHIPLTVEQLMAVIASHTRSSRNLDKFVRIGRARIRKGHEPRETLKTFRLQSPRFVFFLGGQAKYFGFTEPGVIQLHYDHDED